MQRVFGQGGVIDNFAQTKIDQLMDKSGPVWRWKSDNQIAAALNPSSGEEFAKAQKIRDLMVGGLPFKISLISLGADVKSASFATGGTTYSFDALAKSEKPVIWASGGLPSAEVKLIGVDGTTEVGSWETEGSWALFRLIDKSRMENAGPMAIKVKFGDGSRAAQFRISLPSESNPFSRGGIWSFRCPAAL